jgi:hypothetical protein
MKTLRINCARCAPCGAQQQQQHCDSKHGQQNGGKSLTFHSFTARVSR